MSTRSTTELDKQSSEPSTEPEDIDPTTVQTSNTFKTESTEKSETTSSLPEVVTTTKEDDIITEQPMRPSKIGDKCDSSSNITYVTSKSCEVNYTGEYIRICDTQTNTIKDFDRCKPNW